MVFPRTFFLYWFIRGYLSFAPMNLSTNWGSIGVMLGGFDPAALRALTDVGDRIMATPPGILPLDPMAVSSHFCQKTMCSRTSLLPDPIVPIS